jgi:uncharacterized protein (TIGR02246 family)
LEGGEFGSWEHLECKAKTSAFGIRIAALLTMIVHVFQNKRRQRRRFAALVLFIVLSTSLCVKAADVPVVTKRVDASALLSNAVDEVVLAWNKQDSERIVGFFLPDASLVMPTGKVARTRAGIRARLLEEWNGKLKDTTLSHSVEAVSFNGGDTAVVKGKYRLTGVKILGLEKGAEGTFVFDHKRTQGRWMIAKAQLLRDKAN